MTQTPAAKEKFETRKLSRFARVSEAGVRRRNPERSEGTLRKGAIQ
ncbi:MAG: hypothetical protein L0Z53_10470 [Acidobacteriales bacterium]|nr:hypothetical protein [Terriglobales bacterium]